MNRNIINLIDQVINQPVESLPANSYFTSLAALDENEVRFK